MSEKAAKFTEYYQSDRFKSELKLPDNPSFHHFRFECFGRGTFKRLYDVINSEQVLTEAILKNQPKNVLFTPVKWLDSVNVRRKRDKQVNDYMLSSPLYFDIDADLPHYRTLQPAIDTASKLIDYIDDKKGRRPDWIVFSGSRGFHIYYWEWDDVPKHFLSADSRISAFRKNRLELLTELQTNGIAVDKSVTADPWRVLRVPGTLHGNTGLIAKAFKTLKEFSIEKTRP